MKVRITKIPDKNSESLNARKWKHADGGLIERALSDGKADVVREVLNRLKNNLTP